MNIVFFGTSEFALVVLRKLLASDHKVSLVVTQPDRKKGRSLHLAPPETKVLAEAHGIHVYQPADASSFESVEYLRGIDADMFVVVAFGQILKKEILSIPKFCCINIHSSLLPKYRGAAPVNRAIMAGETVTGVTIMRMDERMDAGDIILCRETAIGPEDTSITVNEKLSDIGSELLLEALAALGSKKASFTRQDSGKATYAPKLRKEDGLIRWDAPAKEIRDLVRGSLPWPGAYTYLAGKVLKVLKAELFPGDIGSARPGEVLDHIRGKGILVQTGEGMLVISHLQLEGKKALDADAFLRGHGIPKGYLFSFNK